MSEEKAQADKPIYVNPELHTKLKTRASAERKTLKRFVEKHLRPLVSKNGEKR